MVRGNWQRRVEKAEKRKVASRRRKQRRGDRTANRERVRAFLRALDGDDDADGGGGGVGGEEVHLWVDVDPKASRATTAGSPPPVESDNETRTSSRKRGGGSKQGAGGGAATFDDDDDDEEAVHSPKGKRGKKKKGKRGGGNDHDEATATSSTTTPGGSGRKKAHPRSHENFSPGGAGADENGEEEPPPLCRGHFFAGKCPSGGPSSMGGKGAKGGGGGGGGCLLEHYSARHGRTMAEVLGLKRSKKSSAKPFKASEEALAQLALSSDAAAAAEAEEDEDTEPGGTNAMGMVYHLPVRLYRRGGGAEGETDETKLSEAISETLGHNGCAMSNVVYCVIDGYIAFDRHGGDLLTPPKGRTKSVGGEFDDNAACLHGGDSNKAISDEDAVQLARLASHLPAHILERFLGYLPESSAASLPRVCGGWHAEIGTSSPDLWRTLLRRRGWPEPPSLNSDGDAPEGGGGGALSERDRYRAAFVSHYAGLRDLAALRSGLRAASRPGRRLKPSREYACLKGDNHDDADDDADCCAVLRPWSPGRVLAARGADNTVELFEASPANATVTARGEAAACCRRIARVRTAPFPPSRRIRCELRGMDLDDDLVGCLFRVVSVRRGGEEDDCRDEDGHRLAGSNTPVPWLTVAKRDDLLCASGGGGGGGRGIRPAEIEDEEALRKFDLREAVVDFLLAAENRRGDGDDDNNEMPGVDPLVVLVRYLARGHGPSRVIVDVCPDLVACGGGRFLFEAALVVPRRGEHEADRDDGGDDDDSDILPAPPGLAARKLCLFSVTGGGGRITWMRDSDPSESSQFIGADLRLAGGAALGSGARRGASCHAALTSSETAGSIRVSVSSRTGNVESVRDGAESEALDAAILGWEDVAAPSSFAFVGGRPAAATASDIVVGHTVLVAVPDREELHRMVLTFCSVSSVPTGESDAPLLPTLTVKGGGIISDIVPLRDSDHVVVLFRSIEAEARNNGPEAAAPEEDFEGEWFGGHEDQAEEDDDDDGGGAGEGEDGAAPAGHADADSDPDDVPESDGSNFVCALLVHVPTRSAVGLPVRLCGEDVPVSLCGGAGTLAMDAGGRSVVLTGWAVRAAADAGLGAGSELGAEGDEKVDAKKKKKKKKRLAGHAKGKKKDEFAMGMSLRG